MREPLGVSMRTSEPAGTKPTFGPKLIVSPPLAVETLQVFAESSPPPMNTAKQLISDPDVGLSDVFHSGPSCADTDCCAAGPVDLAFFTALTVAGAVGKTMRTFPVSSFFEHAVMPTVVSNKTVAARTLTVLKDEQRTMLYLSDFGAGY